MKKRNPILVFILTCVTFSFYGLVWYAKTKTELKARGAKIPTMWTWIFVPYIIVWLWKYSKGVYQVTNGKMSAGLAFILLFLLGPIGMMLVQSEFNDIG